MAPDELRAAIELFQVHERQQRPRERDHALAVRDVRLAAEPALPFRPVPAGAGASPPPTKSSPMNAMDTAFLAIVRANPHLRPRVGNPDEMRSNRLTQTLDVLKFRVTEPEPGIPEAIDGAVITALNEEAVACAALANKGGINLIATYEAFGAKMHGAMRQEIVFADHLAQAGRPPGWLSIPLVLTSHTWENAKNERSHQDPAMAEAMLGEPSHVSRVLFPDDWNSALESLVACYRTRGQVWTLVVPKSDVPEVLSAEQATQLLANGALELERAGGDPRRARVVLTAVGAYQLAAALRASERLGEREIAHSVVYVIEPGRFRRPRSPGEARHVAQADVMPRLWPPEVEARLLVSHTRPETMLGVLAPIHASRRCAGLGFVNAGGTLDLDGLLFVNRCSWAHCVDAVADLLGIERRRLLESKEIEALDDQRSLEGVIVGTDRAMAGSRDVRCVA